MSPQEIERTMEFILQHEAQTAAHLERLTSRLDSLAERQGDMQSLLIQMTELARVQSQRLDRHDESFRSIQLWQREALERLDRILDRLTP
jgi:hypothetical protein